MGLWEAIHWKELFFISENSKFVLEEMALATWFEDVAPIQSSFFLRGIHGNNLQMLCLYVLNDHPRNETAFKCIEGNTRSAIYFLVLIYIHRY